MIDPKRKLALVREITVRLESHVADAVRAMSKHTDISADEIINTALRRFIATHKDYLPSSKEKPVRRLPVRQDDPT